MGPSVYTVNRMVVWYSVIVILIIVASCDRREDYYIQVEMALMKELQFSLIVISKVVL